MSDICFDAVECHETGHLKKAAYCFVKDGEHWTVLRDGEPYLELGPGYVPVRVLACGVCSTDLARHHLPFPLPQVTGHEVLGLTEKGQVVVEINSSHQARGEEIASCPYCTGGLHTHCPSRVTLGIDRLPGGFGPWLLAPPNALLPWPEAVPTAVATLTEPFAAALQALHLTPPENGDRVAVLGPRRLGMLLLTALATWRELNGGSFDITAISRHSTLLAVAAVLGADKGLDGDAVPDSALRRHFDIVYDTTGNPRGLEKAIAMARRVVHLKSTHGRAVMGMNHLADLVIDELSLLPLCTEHMAFAWPGEARNNKHILVTPRAIGKLPAVRSAVTYHILEPAEAARKLEQPRYLEDSVLPQFDLAIVSSLAEADQVIRPSGWGRSLVRPRGALLLAPGENTNALDEAIRERGLQLHSSRCGAFSEALDVFSRFPELGEILAELMISHRFPADRLEEALSVAADSRAGIKVVVEHSV